MRVAWLGLFCVVLGTACAPGEQARVPQPGAVTFPEPRVPDDNPVTPEKAELGRRLFFDVRLSANGTQSCASCHDPALAFADGRALSVGSTGDVIPRNSLGLANAAFWSTYTWMNPTLTTLEQQALVPMFSQHPVELGMTDALPEIQARLRADAEYVRLTASAFPDVADPWAPQHLVKAIATFERTLISRRSAYDRYVYEGEADALDEEERLGMQLFFSERTECYHCHAGPLFSTAFSSATSAGAQPGFENTGVYNLDESGAYPAPNVGLYEFTRDPADMGKMRVPSLRNLSYTAPYFHDGSAPTLEDVLAHYIAGGRTIAAGPNAGVGGDNPNQNQLVRPLTLDDTERAALLAFLRALDDEDFVNDPAFQSPFPIDP